MMWNLYWRFLLTWAYIHFIRENSLIDGNQQDLQSLDSLDGGSRDVLKLRCFVSSRRLRFDLATWDQVQWQKVCGCLDRKKLAISPFTWSRLQLVTWTYCFCDSNFNLSFKAILWKQCGLNASSVVILPRLGSWNLSAVFQIYKRFWVLELPAFQARWYQTQIHKFKLKPQIQTEIHLQIEFKFKVKKDMFGDSCRFIFAFAWPSFNCHSQWGLIPKSIMNNAFLDYPW